jgi:hypothetical protein
MLLRELFEQSGRTAVLAFGRLNPPTTGHAKLIEKLKSIPGDHFLFLSHSQKPKTDPLDFNTKLKFAQSFFPDIKIGHPEVNTPVAALQHLQSKGYTDVIFVAGSDRVEGFQKLFDTYNGQPDKSGTVPFEFNSIRVISAGERDPDADDVSGMSASKMRAAAVAGDIESFSQGVPNPKLAQQMYDAVRSAMGVKENFANENIIGKQPDSKNYLLQLERDKRANMLILHILDKGTGKRTEVRGKMGYETNGYDPQDKLHQLLDKVGKSASVSDLMNGDVVSINPRHPDGASAKAAADNAYNENVAGGKVKYTKPQFDVEWEEAERYPEFVKIGKAAWIELANKGKAVTIKSAKGINNTDAADADSLKSLDKDKQARVLAQLKSGNVEMPIVAVYPDGWKELIGGNTRLTAMLAQDGKATVWVFKVPNEVAELAENFADGKNPGRKGLAKRSGVNTKASVSSLRKTAKNSSGEKQRMAHWLANMKAGRQKAAKK